MKNLLFLQEETAENAGKYNEYHLEINDKR